MVPVPVSVVATLAWEVESPTVKVSVLSLAESSTVFTVKVFFSPAVPLKLIEEVFSV